VKITVQSAWVLEGGGDFGRLGFEILHAYDISMLAPQPGKEAFGGSRTDPVEIQGDNAHGKGDSKILTMVKTRASPL
jgi:hypothetical protein